MIGTDKPFMTLRSASGIDVVVLTGELDHHAGVPRLEKTLALLKGRGGAKVLLDFHDVTYCCSSAIAQILDASETVKERGGVLVLAAVSGPPRDPMELLDIPDVVPFFETTAEALEALEAGDVSPAMSGS